jgi:hypothetical protein
MTDTPRPSSPTRLPRPFPTILHIAEQGITVADFASMTLWTAPAEADAQQTYEEMRQRDYDVAPIADPYIWRFAEKDTLRSFQGTIGDAARPIRVTELVAEHLGLLETVKALERAPLLFVLRGAGVVGVVTRADVQRHAVSMAALGLVLAAEQGLVELVRRNLGNDWQRLLTSKRMGQAQRLLRERQRHNTAIDLIQCLGLEDLMRIAIRDRAIREGLHYGRDAMEEWAEQLRRVRDTLAHAGGLLDAEPAALQAIKLFLHIQRFAERIWLSLEQSAEAA